MDNLDSLKQVTLVGGPYDKETRTIYDKETRTIVVESDTIHLLAFKDEDGDLLPYDGLLDFKVKTGEYSLLTVTYVLKKDGRFHYQE